MSGAETPLLRGDLVALSASPGWSDAASIAVMSDTSTQKLVPTVRVDACPRARTRFRIASGVRQPVETDDDAGAGTFAGAGVTAET